MRAPIPTVLATVLVIACAGMEGTHADGEESRFDGVETTIALYEPPTELGSLSVASTTHVDKVASGATAAENELAVQYSYVHAGEALRIQPEFGYLERLKGGGPIVNGDRSHLTWDFPELSIQCVNNSRETLHISEIRVDVRHVRLIDEPIPFLTSSSAKHIRIENLGWGDMIGAIVRFATREKPPEEFVPDFEATSETFALESIGDIAEIGIEFPQEMGLDEQNSTIQTLIAFGTLEYRTPAGRPRSTRFLTEVDRLGRITSARPPTSQSTVKLKQDLDPGSKFLSVSHTIDVGQADHFTLRVAADRSIWYDLEIAVLAAGGQQIAQQRVEIELFVPRDFGRTNSLKTKKSAEEADAP